jgi:ribonuclease HII
MRLACERALAGISAAYADIVLDGSYNFLSTNLPVRTMVRADVSVPAVSAASIVAKVARDARMADIAARYPGYGFERHVGYGTASHRVALLQYGPSPIHRRSFAPVRSLEQGHE